jgi:hypothetical protein
MRCRVVGWLVSELENCWGSVVMSCCWEKLVADAAILLLRAFSSAGMYLPNR